MSRGQLRSIIREETRRLVEGGVETCPYCNHEFLADQGDYSTPGRAECPECGGDFDAAHDDDYEDEMDDDSSDEDESQDSSTSPCPDCGAEDTYLVTSGAFYCQHCDNEFHP